MLSGKYLRIRTPQTIDGVNLKYTEEGKVVYKETDAPLTAKPHLERENADYEQVGKPHLKHIITEVSEETPLYTGKKAKTKEEFLAEMRKDLIEDLKASGMMIVPITNGNPSVEEAQPAKQGRKKSVVENTEL